MLKAKIKFNRSFVLVFLVTLVWFLLIFSRYFIPISDSKNNSNNRVYLADKFLFITLLEPQKINSFNEFKKGILTEAVDIYRQKDLYSGDDNLKLKLAILYAEQGEEKFSKIAFRELLPRATECFLPSEADKSHTKMVWDKPAVRGLQTTTETGPYNLYNLVYNIYYTPKAVKDLKQSSEILKLNLSGYFLARALQRLYLLKKVDFSVTPEYKKNQKIAESLIVWFFIFSFGLVFLFTAGVVLIFLFLFKKKAPHASVVPVWSFAQGWIIFIFWDWLQVLFAVIFRFLGVKIESVGIFAVVYISLSLVALTLIFKVINPAPGLWCGANNNLQLIGFKFDNLSRKISLGIGGWLCAFPIVGGVILLNSFIYKNTVVSSNPIFDLLTKPMSLSDKIILFLIVGIFAPIIEEIVFRGFLYTTFRGVFSSKFAIFLVAFIFAFVHADKAGLLPIFGLGYILTYLYDYSGSLVPSVVVHSLWNSGTFLAFMVLFS